MNNLNYNHLYYFWIIATEGGVTQACKKLNLTQPTLSAQLKLFEQSIGKNLFERKARKLTLNDAGRLVFDYADTIFKKGREMIDALQETASAQAAMTLQVGAVSSLPKKNLHNFLKTPIQDSKINIRLSCENFSTLIDHLSSHKLDMVLSDRPAPTAIKGFVSHLLERVPVIFVASPEYKNLRRKFPSSLNHHPLFLPPLDWEIREKLNAFLTINKVIPHIKGEIQDTELMRVIAVSGQGIAAMPRSAVSDLIKAKALYIIGDNLDIWQNYYLITADRKDPNPAILEIINRANQ